MLYLLVRSLARLTVRLFFRRIEIEGRDQVPATGPILLVPNHNNALVDPLLLMIAMRRRLTLTAKNVLGNNPLVGLLMSGLGVITFHRRQDVGLGADPRQNLRSVQQCRDVLKRGGAICIFPEGVSHSDPHMRRFRPGAARIALDYLQEDGNPGGLKIVPVGLLYTAKDQFRSAVWLRFGPPLDVADWLRDHEADTNELTEEIRRRVEAITLNFETRRESAILSWAAEIIVSNGLPPAPLGWKEPPVHDWFAVLQRMQAGYRQLARSHPEEVEQVTRRVRQYRAELRRLGIAPGEVYLPLHGGKAAFFLFRELELLLIGAPFALFGAINHVVPYLLVKGIARKLSSDKDHWATNAIYPSFVVFPLFYAVQLTLAWCLLPALWAGLYTLALPYTGFIALLYGERLGAMLRRLRTFLFFLANPRRQDDLAREGRELIAAIRALGEQVVADAGVATPAAPDGGKTP